MAELVDAYVSEAYAARHASSILVSRTTKSGKVCTAKYGLFYWAFLLFANKMRKGHPEQTVGMALF
jgi:hypothetical protein